MSNPRNGNNGYRHDPARKPRNRRAGSSSVGGVALADHGAPPVVAMTNARNPGSSPFVSASGFSALDNGDKPFPKMTPNDPNKPPLTAVGAAGNQIFAGIIAQDAEYNPDFYWRDAVNIYEMMRRNDAQINAVLQMLYLPIERAKVRIIPASDQPIDKEIASLVESCLFHDLMYETTEGRTERQQWQSILQHILLMLPFGFSVFGKWFRVDEDGWVKWARWEPYLARTVWRWWVGADSQLVGIQQRTFKDWKIEYEDIHADRLLRFAWRQEGNNYDGWSVLRSAYQHWYYLTGFYKLQAITVERTAVTPPIGHLAPEDRDQAAAQQMLNQLVNMRVSDSMGVVLPSGQQIDYPDPHMRGNVEIEFAINHHDTKIARNVLAQFINLGSTETGAYALADVQTRTFMQAEESVAQYIESVINTDAIPELVNYNYDGVSVYPRISFDAIADDDVKDIAAAIQQLASFITPDPEFEDYVRSLVGAPSAPKSVVVASNPTAPAKTAQSGKGDDQEDSPAKGAPEQSGQNSQQTSGGVNDGGDNTGGSDGGGDTGGLTELAQTGVLLKEALSAIYGADAVDRGLLFYNPNHYGPGAKGGQFAPKGGGGGGGSAGAGGGKASGGGAKKSAKGGGSVASPKAKAAALRASGGSGTRAAKAVAAAPKPPTVAEQKAAAELRLKNATKHAAQADREYKAAEKAAADKQVSNSTEITRLRQEYNAAYTRNIESYGKAKEAIAEERARAKGESGKAPKTYERMQAAKQPYEDAKTEYAAAKAKVDASRAIRDDLVEKYSGDYKSGRSVDQMMKDHPDLKQAWTQYWKDSSATDKAGSRMHRAENKYMSARDQLAGKISDADIEAHPERLAAKAALDDVTARLGEATGQTALRAAFEKREAAHNELNDAKYARLVELRQVGEKGQAVYQSANEWPSAKLEEARGFDRSNLDRHEGDLALASLVHTQGYDGKPDIVSEDELNVYVQHGEVELWRGDTKPQHTENMMNGDYHVGLGIRGNGTYAQEAARDGHAVAHSYAKDHGNDGLIMRMSVKSDARVVDYDDLRRQARQAVAQARHAAQAATDRGDSQAVRHARAVEWLASSDTSRFATALGYDAIRVPSHGQWIVLNRTALRISNQIRSQ